MITLDTLTGETKKCAKDFVHFCEKHIKLCNKQNGLYEPFILNKSQKELINLLNDNLSVISKLNTNNESDEITHLICAWFLWNEFFKRKENYVILTRSPNVIYSILEDMISHIEDEEIKSKDDYRITKENEMSFNSCNKSRIIIRNYFAFKNVEKIEKFYFHEPDNNETCKNIVESIQNYGSQFIVTSMYGSNWFNSTYDLAYSQKNEFNSFFYDTKSENPKVVIEEKLNKNNNLFPEMDKKCNWKPNYKFKEYSPAQAKAVLENHLKETPDHPLDHPEFDELLSFTEKEAEDIQVNRVIFGGAYGNEKIKKFEKKIIENTTNEELVLAGIKSVESLSEKPQFRIDNVIISEIMETGLFAKDLELSWNNGRLCISGIATSINEEDVRNAYNGLLALEGLEKSVDYIVSIIVDKLKPLFGKI